MLRVPRLHVPAILAAVALGAGGCHHAAPPAAVPVTTATNDDAARLARMRADSIARADAARREAAARASARADSVRRAGEAARTAEANARAQLLAPIHFDFNRDELLTADTPLLDQKAAILTSNRLIQLRIDGNADERGSDEYNLGLGMRRAARVRRYLIDRGIDSTRIALTSNGEERPLCTEHTDSCWNQNRRAEFVIVSGGERITAAR